MFSHIFSRSVQMFCADHRSVKITDGNMHPRNRIIFCMGHRGVKIAQTSKPLPPIHVREERRNNKPYTFAEGLRHAIPTLYAGP